MSSVEQQRLLLQIQPLPDLCQPARVGRGQGITLLWCDPRALRTDTLLWMADHLTTDELNGYRAAYQIGPVGTLMPEGLCEGVMGTLAIPPCLAIPEAASSRATG